MVQKQPSRNRAKISGTRTTNERSRGKKREDRSGCWSRKLKRIISVEKEGEREERRREDRNSGVVGLALGFLCLVYAPLQQTDKKRRASKPTEFLDSSVGWWSLTKRRMVCGNRGPRSPRRREKERERERGRGGSRKRVRWRGTAGPNGSHLSHPSRLGEGDWTVGVLWMNLPAPLPLPLPSPRPPSTKAAVLLVCTPISTWNSLFLPFSPFVSFPLSSFLSFFLPSHLGPLFPFFSPAFSPPFGSLPRSLLLTISRARRSWNFALKMIESEDGPARARGENGVAWAGGNVWTRIRRPRTRAFSFRSARRSVQLNAFRDLAYLSSKQHTCLTRTARNGTTGISDNGLTRRPRRASSISTSPWNPKIPALYDESTTVRTFREVNRLSPSNVLHLCNNERRSFQPKFLSLLSFPKPSCVFPISQGLAHGVRRTSSKRPASPVIGGNVWTEDSAERLVEDTCWRSSLFLVNLSRVERSSRPPVVVPSYF